MRLASHEGGGKTDFSMPQLIEALTDVRPRLVFSFDVLVTIPRLFWL
jgi:hypothetical protein